MHIIFASKQYTKYSSVLHVDAKMLPISKESLGKRKSIEENKAAVMASYAQNKYRQFLFPVGLFWRENHVRCGICVCV